MYFLEVQMGAPYSIYCLSLGKNCTSFSKVDTLRGTYLHHLLELRLGPLNISIIPNKTSKAHEVQNFSPHIASGS